MIKKAIMMLALLAAPFALQAQTQFHDVEANDAKGPVKSITMTIMGHTQSFTYTTDGKMQTDGMSDAVYDADGYLQSYVIEAQGMQTKINYTWENGRVTRLTTIVMGQTISVTSTYDDNGIKTSDVMDMGTQQMDVTYSDYKFDDHGNWISRKMNVMGRDMEMPRTIEYYE